VNPMTPTAPHAAASPELIAALRKFALKLEPVMLSSGEQSDYYVDVKQAMLRPGPVRLVGPLIAEAAHRVGARAVGGMVEGAIPVACAAIGCQEGNDLGAFFIRNGLQRRIEGPDEYLKPGEPCLIVDDVVTSGASTVDAIRSAKEEGLLIKGAVAVVDRLAGGQKTIEAALDGAPYWPLVTIDDLHPARSDRR
jgi:orotate phosphoribosyltransferase